MHLVSNITRQWFRILIMALCSLLVTATGHGSNETTDCGLYGGEYRIPVASEPMTLDPALCTGIYDMNVAANLFDGLVEFDNQLNVVPAIAEIWKISRDHRTYSFRLRQGVKFHNNREVTAHDFKYSFSRILSPDTQSPAASLFFNIRGAQAFHEGRVQTVSGLRAKDDSTLIIELEKPFAPFLSIIAMVNARVVPQEAMGPDFGKHPIGTGPFRFRSWRAGQEIVLEANQRYFAGRPYLDTLRFAIYHNVKWEKIVGDFENGFLEQTVIPSRRYEKLTLERNPSQKPLVISKPGLNIVYLGMNMNMPMFKKRKVRQAIYYAIDRAKIVKNSTHWRSAPAKGLLPPGIAGFDPHFDVYPYNPEKARRLLAEAGYAGGRGIPKIELLTVAKTDRVKQQLLAYQSYLAAIGIQVIPKVAKNWEEVITRINDKQAAMFYAAWYADFPDPDNFLYTLCHSKSRANRMGYHNPHVDRLLEQARVEIDYLKRVKQYREIEKLVMQDAPLICQHVNSFNYVFQPWVKGVHMSHLGAVYLPFRQVWLDHQL